MPIFYSRWKQRASWAGGLAVALSLLGCGPGLAPPSRPATPPALQPSPSLAPAATAAASALAPPTSAAPRLATVPLPDPDRTAWPGPINRFQQMAALPEGEAAGPVTGFYLARDRVTFRVHYAPGEPRYIAQWAYELSAAGLRPLLVFPAGFFTEEYFAQGLLVADGALYSEAHDVGGVFTVQAGEPDIRWLRSQPIQPGEAFEQAVQSFPLYVHRGRIVPVREHVARAPRTVLVETRSGDFIVLLSLTNLFRTTDMPQWLMDSGLEVYNALNLDGGRSAGYWASEGDFADSFVPLPAVIAVYAK